MDAKGGSYALFDVPWNGRRRTVLFPSARVKGEAADMTEHILAVLLPILAFLFLAGTLFPAERKERFFPCARQGRPVPQCCSPAADESPPGMKGPETARRRSPRVGTG